jgi:competence protein ComEC
MPVLRFLIPFILGLLLGDYVALSDYPLMIFGVLLLLSVGMVLTLKTKFARRHYFGIFLQLFLLVAGYGLCFLSLERLWPSHFEHEKKREKYMVELVSGAQQKPKSFKFKTEVKAIFDGKNWKATSGKVALYLSKKNFRGELFYGDQIVFLDAPEEILLEKDKSYTALSHHRQIFHRLFVREYVKVNLSEPKFSFMALAITCRKWVAAVLMEQFNYTKEAAIAVALMVGDEIPIDQELSTAYAATGTLHVLAVSGMHVGLIYFLLGFLLKPLLKTKYGKHLYYPLVILLVWCYALIAGAAPSITRAATMCTFHMMAIWMDKKNEGIGALGASLFFILMVNPFNLYEPGLQLSFFAVLGIIWLQRPILKVWIPKNKWMYKMWELSSVSIAAQIMTMPVSLFYFGQFPNYFILANLIVIPITTLTIYTCILQLLCMTVPCLLPYVVWFNQSMLSFSNYLVMHMQHLPGAVSTWKVGMTEMIFLYAYIVVIIRWCQTKKIDYILKLLSLMVLFSSLKLFQII